MRNLAIATIVVWGLVSLVIGVIAKFIGSNIAFSPRGYGEFTIICLLLSINLFLLDEKS